MDRLCGAFQSPSGRKSRTGSMPNIAEWKHAPLETDQAQDCANFLVTTPGPWDADAWQAPCAGNAEIRTPGNSFRGASRAGVNSDIRR